MFKQIGIAAISLAFVMAMALPSLAAREVVTGTIEKVDAMTGQITVKTQAGPRQFNSRTPEKLKDLKPGDKINLTIEEDGNLVVQKDEGKK